MILEKLTILNNKIKINNRYLFLLLFSKKIKFNDRFNTAKNIFCFSLLNKKIVFLSLILIYVKKIKVKNFIKNNFGLKDKNFCVNKLNRLNFNLLKNKKQKKSFFEKNGLYIFYKFNNYFLIKKYIKLFQHSKLIFFSKILKKPYFSEKYISIFKIFTNSIYFLEKNYNYDHHFFKDSFFIKNNYFLHFLTSHKNKLFTYLYYNFYFFAPHFFFNLELKTFNNFFLKNVLKTNFYSAKFIKYLLFINDKNTLSFLPINYDYISNKFITNFFNFFDNNFYFNFKKTIKKNFVSYNNYYPIVFSNKFSYNSFFSKFKNNYDIDYILFTNKFIVSFLEKNYNKFIFIKYINNFFNKINNYYLESILTDYKNFQPAFWKSFLIKDFIKILWYSFFLKDLTMISNWISIFMETLHFKNHKKFLSFFSNFLNKYASIFIDILKLKGFFFDIRGKVGVTGSSKKRHLCFKFGSLNKSSKKTKLNFNQNLVRTYSGVLGLTYIISY